MQTVFPCELLQHDLWWNGPDWLCESKAEWPMSPDLIPIPDPMEEEICLHTVLVQLMLRNYSSFTDLKRVTGWVIHAVCSFHEQLQTLSRDVCSEARLLVNVC